MTDLTLRIEYAGGDTDELNIVSADDLGDADAPSLTSIRTERRIDRPPDEPDTAECAVYRDAWSEIEDSLGGVGLIRRAIDPAFDADARETRRIRVAEIVSRHDV